MGSHELLQVERLKVGHVLEILTGKGFLGQGEHPLGQRMDVCHKAGIGMHNLVLALGRSVAEEIHGTGVQVFPVRIPVYDIGGNFAQRTQCPVIHRRIDLHATGVNHGTQQGVLRKFILQQQGHAHHLGRGYRYQRQVAPIADALRHRHADAQAGVRTRAAAHGHGIHGDGMAVGKRQRFVHIHTQRHRMRRPFEISFGKDTLKPVRGLLKELRKKGIYIIEDVTQILLNKNLDIQTADFVIGSIRKWCAVPDGGFIKNNSEKKIRVEKLVENIGFVNKQIEAQKVKASYVKSLDKKLKEEYTKLFRDSKEILDNNKNIYHISNITKNILKQSDFESIKEKRKNNYNYLYNNLKKFDFIKCPLGELEQEEVPLYCPILININKKEFQRFMANSDIYLPIIWPKAKEYLASLRFDCDIIYEQIICIPCDQRYDIDDMKRIILGIEEYERGYRK